MHPHAGVPLDVWRHVLDTEPNDNLQKLAAFSERDGELMRTYFSDAHKQAAKQLAEWMQARGPAG
jgi:hypothetical protein